MNTTLKKIADSFFSMLVTVVLLLLFATSIGYATFAENNQGTEVAKALVYNAHWLEVVYVLLVVNLIGSIFKYNLVLRQKWSVLAFHLAFLLILAGAAVTRYTSSEGMMHIREGQASNEISSDKTSLRIVADADGYKVERSVEAQLGEKKSTQAAQCMLGNVKVRLSYGVMPQLLPFSITLRDFQLERYPGSNSPSSYASEITVTDSERKMQRPYRIFMNNILNYRGYRFFQSSYDEDELGTVLSVSHDYWGTLITYAGYLMLVLGMAWTLFNKHSRFRTLLQLSSNLQTKREHARLKGKAAVLAGLMLFSVGAQAQTVTKEQHLNQVGRLLIQDVSQGRIEPFSTFASDVFRKISKKTSYQNASSVEVLLGMMSNPSYWQNEPIVKVSNDKLEKELGGVDDYVSFNQLFDFENGNAYKLSDKVDAVYRKEQTLRDKYDKEVLNVDERINICYEIYTGVLPALLPVAGQLDAKWTTVAEEMETQSAGAVCPQLLHPYLSAVLESAKTGN